jgi:hypothetical protein
MVQQIPIIYNFLGTSPRINRLSRPSSSGGTPSTYGFSLPPTRLPLLREAEICERAGHKNGQPTHPKWNAQPADLYLPPEDDPQQMNDRHDQKQRGGDLHIGFSVQSAAFPPRTPKGRQ